MPLNIASIQPSKFFQNVTSDSAFWRHPRRAHWPFSQSALCFDVSEVSDDVWIEIALFCGLKEVLCLESTCKFLRNVFMSDRLFWLRRLHMLEQNEAPDLPRHIPISTLTSLKLRGLVIGAHRRYLNCINRTPLRRLQQPQITREITVFPHFPEPDAHSWSRPELLPGGALFLVVCRPAKEVGTNQYLGFLRCFNVPGGECVWTYKPDKLDVRGFGYDMQANGGVHVLTESGPVSGFENNNRIGPRPRILEITKFSPHTNRPESLYKVVTEGSLAAPQYLKLSGDVLAVGNSSRLVLTF